MATKLGTRKPKHPSRGPNAAPARLEHVMVSGVGLLSRHEFSPTRSFDSGEGEGQWIVLLGDNGTGKTTLLRSIAVATADPHSSPYVFARGAWSSAFQREARVVVRVNGVDCSYTGYPTGAAGISGPSVQYDVFGYGSFRGSAHGGPSRDVDLALVTDCATLFDPYARVVHAETWLRNEAFRAERDKAWAKSYENILGVVASLLPGSSRIEVSPDEVLVIDEHNRAAPLSALSDGYLVALGWTIDLIARWVSRYRDTGKLHENFAKDMPCVVLVDELDLHLHPKWQLDIIPRLRAAFPKTTFVVTTHNPLTLQGTRPGEVFVLQKDDAIGQISIAQRDVPPGTDANRLLTGDWFGLGSTLDESTLRKLDRHRELLLARRPESDPERRALEQELRVRLNGFADTSYERMALDVIAQLHDEKMRQRKDITAEDRERVVREVRARLAALDEPTGAREPATGARESGPTYRPAKPPGKAPPKASRKLAGKPSPRKPTAKTKPAARTRRR